MTLDRAAKASCVQACDPLHYGAGLGRPDVQSAAAEACHQLVQMGGVLVRALAGKEEAGSGQRAGGGSCRPASVQMLLHLYSSESYSTTFTAVNHAAPFSHEPPCCPTCTPHLLILVSCCCAAAAASRTSKACCAYLCKQQPAALPATCHQLHHLPPAAPPVPRYARLPYEGPHAATPPRHPGLIPFLLAPHRHRCPPLPPPSRTPTFSATAAQQPTSCT